MRLLAELFDRGVTTHHSSSEYERHPVYIASLERLVASGRRPQHIVKLAEPGFDSEDFDPSTLIRSVDRALMERNCGRLDIVQWLMRTPHSDDARVKRRLLKRSRSEIDGTLSSLIRSGKVGAFSFFPYTFDVVADVLHGVPSVTGVCIYLNMIESEQATLPASGVPTIAIRPLAAGLLAAQTSAEIPVPLQALRSRPAQLRRRFRLSEDQLLAESLRYPLMCKSVATEVVSISSLARFDQIADSLSGQVADAAGFQRLSVYADEWKGTV